MRMELASIARTNRKPIAGVEPFGQQTLHFNIKLYRQTRTTDFFLTAIRCRHQERKSIGMGAGDAVKRIGRADQPQQLAGPADAPRELFLSRRSISTFSRRYGLAEPQLLPVGFGTCRANVAWRSAVSMPQTKRKQRRAARRPRALPNPRREGAQKTGGPTPQKGVRCVRAMYIPRQRTTPQATCATCDAMYHQCKLHPQATGQLRACKSYIVL